MGNTPKEKLLGMLGLCIRARRAVCGTVNVCEALKAGKAKLVVAACDNSAATDKRLSDRTAFYGVKLIKTDDSKEIPVELEYDGFDVKVTPKEELQYDTQYKLIVSDAKNMFDAVVEESEIPFKTAKKSFRIEDAECFSNNAEIVSGNTVTEIKCTARVVNDSLAPKNYKLIFALTKNGEIIKAVCDDITLCAEQDENNAEAVISNFDTVVWDGTYEVKTILLNEKNLDAMDEYAEITDSFGTDTQVTLKGNVLDINAVFASSKPRALTMAMLPFNNESISWDNPGYVLYAEADEKGVFKTTVNVSEYISSGNYALVLWGEGVENEYISYAYYTGKDKRDEVTATLQGNDGVQISTLLTTEDNAIYLKSMGVMFDEFNALSQNKQYVINEVLRLPATEKANEKLCIKNLNKYIVLAMIKESSNKTDTFMSFFDTLETDERIKETLNSMKTAEKLNCFALLFDTMEYETLNQFESNVKDITFVSGINAVATSDYESVQKHLEKYWEVLGYKVSGKFSASKINEYNSILILKSLIGQDYTDKSQIDSAIISGISSYKPAPPYQGGGGGGGTSSGGGGGPKYAPIATGNVEVIEKKEETPLFSDLETASWAKNSILELAQKNIISGYDDKTFRPNERITRAEYVKILVNALFERTEVTECDFNDVPATHWAYDYIANAVNNGIINGVTDKSFAPDAYITREQAATICFRTAQKLGIALTKKESKAFNDFNDVSVYAKKAVTELGACGLMSGDENGDFKPSDETTRAQAAQIIYNLLSFKEE